jgi:2-iminobutanoate/2-iminopropanoate deaminase
MAIKREKLQPQGIHVRMMAGQPAYTQVVTVSGTGRQIFVAGQLARDADGNYVGKGDMRAQIQQAGENIKTCLEAAGGHPRRHRQDQHLRHRLRGVRETR